MDSSRNVFGFIHIRAQSAQPVQAAGWTIAPQARSLRIDFPNQHGGFIWNRPIAVYVSTADGTTRRLPVVDRTRQAQILIWLMVWIVIFIAWLFSSRRES